MSSSYLSHAPAERLPHSPRGNGRTERTYPVALLAFAKVVVIASGLAILTPLWLDLLVRLGSTEYWYTLRLVALGGGAAFVTFAFVAVRILVDLVKHLARA